MNNFIINLVDNWVFIVLIYLYVCLFLYLFTHTNQKKKLVNFFRNQYVPIRLYNSIKILEKENPTISKTNRDFLEIKFDIDLKLIELENLLNEIQFLEEKVSIDNLKIWYKIDIRSEFDIRSERRLKLMELNNELDNFEGELKILHNELKLFILRKDLKRICKQLYYFEFIFYINIFVSKFIKNK